MADQTKLRIIVAVSAVVGVALLACSSDGTSPAATSPDGGGAEAGGSTTSSSGAGTSSSGASTSSSGGGSTSSSSSSGASPPRVQFYFTGTVSNPPAATCGKPLGNYMTLGTDPQHPVPDGPGGLAADCTIAKADAGGFVVKVQIDGQNPNPTTPPPAFQIGFGSTATGNSGDVVQVLTLADEIGPCTLTYDKPGQGIAEGRLWASFDCTTKPAGGSADQDCRMVGELLVENCKTE